MRLIERIRCKLFPVGPNFLQYFRIMTILLPTGDKLRLHLVQFVPQLLTHRFTQGIRFPTGKIRQQTGKQHHLFLIDCNPIRILQILFHDRNIVFDRFTSVLTINKIRNIIHRSRSIQCIHRNQVLESRRLQFTQILLHPCRFKLECSDSSSVTIQFIGRHILNIDFINIKNNPFTMLDVFNRFLDNGKSLQPQEVHLDQSRIFNNGTFILGHQHLFTGFLIICCTDRNPVCNIISTDNRTTSMYPRIADIPFQHLGIPDGISQNRIG